MPYEHSSDDDLDRSTNKVMFAGTILMVVMILIFPLYRAVEPSNRDEARATQLSSLIEGGDKVFDQSCASCHGVDGGGGTAPALNAKQFLESARDDQIGLLISVGVPGTQMDAWSQDFGGSLTSEQIKSIVAYLRSLEPDAPDNPNWRTPADFTGLFGEDLFTEACSGCHGSDRKGIEDSGPDISSTSEAMDESDQFLIKRIVNGRKEMPQFGQSFTSEQIDSLVAFLRGAD